MVVYNEVNTNIAPGALSPIKVVTWESAPGTHGAPNGAPNGATKWLQKWSFEGLKN